MIQAWILKILAWIAGEGFENLARAFLANKEAEREAAAEERLHAAYLEATIENERLKVAAAGKKSDDETRERIRKHAPAFDADPPVADILERLRKRDTKGG